MPCSSDPGETSVQDTFGVTRKGDILWPGSRACTVVGAADPSPHTILDVDGVGLTNPCMVGLMLRPAPVSMMMSPSFLLISDKFEWSAFLAGTL